MDLLETSQHGKIVAGFKFNDYPTNKVDSRKYTLRNFFPKAVFPQFKRIPIAFWTLVVLVKILS